MKFTELDARMRVFETAQDVCVPLEMYMVARIDGRSFTRLTKEVHGGDAPFDVRFRDYMVETTAHLMQCGFRVVYGYTQSDEILLRFHRKYGSVLAGEASGRFSVLLGDAAAFDCRISQLPNVDRVVDYFRWRAEDVHRNALGAHCYWGLRRMGCTAGQATRWLSRMLAAGKDELLFTEFGINFNDLPAWQRRGCGLYWEWYDRGGRNPVTGESVVCRRRRLVRDVGLPMKEAYGAMVRALVDAD